MERRLAAIIAADMVGFSRQMQIDEVDTLARLRSINEDIVQPTVASHKGRIFKTTGDGFLADFSSATEALNCAISIQKAVNERNAALPEDRQTVFRMGLNIGDVIIEDIDVFGDGVNIAARLEPLASPGGIVVAEVVRDQLHNKVSAGFEPMGPQLLKNIIEPVIVYRVAEKGADTKPISPDQRSSDETRRAVPVLAVLPFTSMSTDAEQEHLADGITEDLITTLSQVGALSVVGRNSAFTFKGRVVSTKEAGRELSAQFLLTGSVRKSGNRIRITAQLTDTDTEAQLWAGRYDRELDDIFAVQDEITLTIATALQVELTEGEQAKLRYTTTDNVAAWMLFIQGLSLFRSVSAETYRQARGCFEQALTHDPESAQIHAMLACVHAIEGRFYWTDDRDHSLEMAQSHAERALALDPENADAWGALGYRYMCLQELDGSIKAYAKAVGFAPDHADLHALYALALTFGERADEAVRQAQTALRLNPLDPGWYSGVLGHAYRYAGQLDKAIAVLSDYNQQSPGFGLVDLVLTYADKGDIETAKQYAQELLERRPDFSVENWALTQNCANPDRLANDRNSLVAADLP